MLSGVVFDWNGTLSDDTERVFSVAMKTVKAVGGKPLRSVTEFGAKARNPWYPFYRDELGCSAPKKVIHKWFCHYMEREEIKEKLFSDAVPLLRFLNRYGIKIGIVSSYPSANLLSEVKSHNISGLLDFVRGDCHAKASHIKAFLKHYRLDPQDVVFVGDMVFDVVEGKKCKVMTAVHLRGVDSRKKLLASKPDFLLPTLAALKRHIE